MCDMYTYTYFFYSTVQIVINLQVQNTVTYPVDIRYMTTRAHALVADLVYIIWNSTNACAYNINLEHRHTSDYIHFVIVCDCLPHQWVST